jgi:hypothetical protein
MLEILLFDAFTECRSHLLTKLPSTASDLQISSIFFKILDTGDGFLEVPVEAWPETQAFINANAAVQHLTCVNDCAERGVAWTEDFNERTNDELQKQYLLQVVEQHRRNFKQCNLNEPKAM